VVGVGTVFLGTQGGVQSCGEGWVGFYFVVDLDCFLVVLLLLSILWIAGSGCVVLRRVVGRRF
jgi:hypothetical protein